MIKKSLKNILLRAKLLELARSTIYWFTRFDANTTHPRRLMRRFYAQFIKKGDLCFDIGANIGDKTGIFLELGAKVVCVEPQKDCIGRLYRSFGHNKNVMIVHKAVASERGTADLAICMEAPVISTMSKRFESESIFARDYGYSWTEKESVSLTTLDLLISQYGMPFFCKIDIEGFEKKAIKGLSKPIPLISLEFFMRFLDDAKECASLLSSIGNYKFNFGIAEPTSGRMLELPQWISSNGLFKELEALRKDNPDLWGDIYARL